MSRSQKDNIYNQAIFSKEVWEEAISVMDMYETGMLKDQKMSRKAIAKPVFKQHLLAPLHNLPATFQVDALRKVSKGEHSLKEMKADAEHFRAM